MFTFFENAVLKIHQTATIKPKYISNHEFLTSVKHIESLHDHEIITQLQTVSKKLLLSAAWVETVCMLSLTVLLLFLIIQ